MNVPSKATGPTRSKRWREGLRSAGLTQISVVIPEGRRDQLRKLAADWVWTDERPGDATDDTDPVLPFGDRPHD